MGVFHLSLSTQAILNIWQVVSGLLDIWPHLNITSMFAKKIRRCLPWFEQFCVCKIWQILSALV